MIKICSECGIEFECYDKVRCGKRFKIKRTSNAVTCSPKCSKEYSRRRVREYNRVWKQKHLKG